MDELGCKNEQILEVGEYFLEAVSYLPQETQTFPCSLWSRIRQPLGVTELRLLVAGSFPCILANGGKFFGLVVAPFACSEMLQVEVLDPVLTPFFLSFLTTIRTEPLLSSPTFQRQAKMEAVWELDFGAVLLHPAISALTVALSVKNPSRK